MSLAVVLGTSACMGLPGTSSVQAGKAVNAGRDDEPLSVEPVTAEAYSEPQDIVAGFIRAQMSTRDDHAAARTFLASSGAWSPGAGATIYDGSHGFTTTRPNRNTVRLTADVVGTLSPDGHLVETGRATSRQLDFTLTRTGAGWRISHAPDRLGLWVSKSDLPIVYRSVTVYYPAAQGRTLVPDPRWLPRQGLTTALARAALSAPPEWLRPAVAADLPAGTGLDVDAVPITDGTATVNLTKAAASLTGEQRTGLWAAMAATVTQDDDVQAVNLTAASVRLEAGNLPSVVNSASDVGYTVNASPVTAVITRGGPFLAWVRADANDSASGHLAGGVGGRPTLPSVPTRWGLLAAGQGGRQVAAVSNDRTSLRRWVNGGDVTVDSLGTGLIRPAFDSSGWLWVAGHAFSNDRPGHGAAGESAMTLWSLDTVSGGASASPQRIDVPWLGNASIRSIALSPEGARVALVVDDGHTSRAVVAAVVRDRKGRPVSLGPAHEQGQGFDRVTDVAWAGPTSLALLGTAGSQTRAGVRPLDGELELVDAQPNATGVISTFNDSSGLFLRTSNNLVYTRLGASWSGFITGGDVVVPSS